MTAVLDKFVLEAGLTRANTTLVDAARMLAARGRVDLIGLPGSALSLLLTEAARKGAPPMLVITPDQDSALACAQDLRFFGVASRAGEDGLPVLRFPTPDTSPFLQVASDRKSAMERVAALCHLAHGLPWQFLVAPVGGLLRKVAPRAALQARSRQLRVTDVIDREALIELLVGSGYLRVPLVEDPGSFAVRGSLVDVYPPHADAPARLELDDELVASIKRFDPDTQRTVAELDHLFVHPARQTLSDGQTRRRVRERVSDLCDSFDTPTKRRNELLDELETGRSVLGLDALLPAYYDQLETLFDYLPRELRCIVVDPTAVAKSASDELERAHADRSAQLKSVPAYPVDALYLSNHDLRDALEVHPIASVHTLAVAGAPEDDESPLAVLEAVSADAVHSLGGDDHAGVLAQLKQQRKEGGRVDALAPLAHAMRGFVESGMRVLVTARTRTQGDRVATLFRGHGLELAKGVEPFTPELLRAPISGKVQVVLGELSRGFVLATAGLACVTETEVFGEKPSRSLAARKSRRTNTEAFLDDLSALSVGDYVVHVDHGIGRYLGLEKKQMPLSRYEQLQGMKPVSVEVLVVEYLGGKLFLPVTRLNQVQKHSSSEGKTPKLDKLGGQTFSKTKARVRDEVKQLADDLLQVYAQRAGVERPPIAAEDRTYAEFEASFPFDETPDQTRAIDDVLNDLTGKRAMDRVVCGDVGFGKTEVAMRAAFRVAMAGRQVAVLCPTTVLAQQHANSFRERMAGYPLQIASLSRFVTREEQAKTLAALKGGQVDIVIGTHRLLSKDVHFKNLGLLVVDEEQRFGVAHKERIKVLRAQVDVLTLSATPIPRTLQMAVSGLRDLSLITTPPVDRRAVRTFVTRWDPHVIGDAIKRELSRGGQAFVVHNRIESLAERAARIQEMVPEARIAVAHGQMNEALLERVMADFVAGRFDVLCSTAIIESGLDIPRANTMIIDRADTYGLAQLYQLRGRVGRSRERAYCYLVAPPPNVMSDEARLRIAALERFTELGSGFKVASLDLELRGAGDVLGAEQSGTVSAVGFDLFLKMLEEAIAELRGTPVAHEIDPELNLETPLLLPDDYIDDVGVRLSLYKRFAGADSDSLVEAIAEEMEDRFGPAPDAARTFVRAMALKPELRRLRVLGCEAARTRVTLHLAGDSPLDVAQLVVLVAKEKGRFKLSPDRKLSVRFDERDEGDAIDRVQALLHQLSPLAVEPSGRPTSR